MSSKMSLTQILTKMAEETEGEETSLGEVFEVFDHRGFGPMLIAPALLAVLPSGAIPGVPSICGIVIFLISSQVVIGRSHPWLPKQLKKISFSNEKFNSAIEKVTPLTKKIDCLLKARIEKLSEKPAKKLVAITCGLTGLLMIPLEVVPFAAALPALGVTIAGLGFTTEDGVAILIAMVLNISAILVLITQVIM